MSSRSRWLTWELGLICGVVLLHGIFALQSPLPATLPDETAYFGNARYMAGGSPPRLEGSLFYHAGYSVLILPAFWFARSAQGAYGLCQLVNALLAGLHVLLVLRFVKLWKPSRNMALAIAAVTSLYAPSWLYTGHTVSENAFGLSLAAVLLLAATDRRDPRLLTAASAAAVGAFCYAVHPRGLLVAPALLVWLVATGVRARRPWSHLLAAFFSASVVFLAFGLLHAHLRQAGWNGTGQHTPVEYGGAMLDLSGAWSVVRAGAGQLWYIGVATVGVAGVGLARLFRDVFAASSSGDRGEHRPPSGLVLAIFGVTLVPSAFTIAYFSDVKNVPYSDYFLYGRYNEGMVTLLIAVGLVALLGRAPTAVRSWIGTGIATALLGIGVHFSHAATAWSLKSEAYNISGVAWMVGDHEWLVSTAIAGGLLLVVVFVVSSVGSRSAATAAGLVAIVLAANTVWLCVDYVPQHAEKAESEAKFVQTMESLGLTEIGIDLRIADDHRRIYLLAQMLLPDRRFLPFEGDREPAPAPVVLTYERYVPDYGGRWYPAVMTGGEAAVWARVEFVPELQRRFRESTRSP